MYRTHRLAQLTLCAASALIPAAPLFASAGSPTGFMGLGDLPGGEFRSSAYGISADGSTVVGSSRGGINPETNEAYRWTKATGMQGIGMLPVGYSSQARAISADGQTIVGSSRHFDGNDYIDQAFRWSQGGGMEPLGYYNPGIDDEPYGSYASAVSADGSSVAGETIAPAGIAFSVGFLWTEPAGLRTLSTASQIPSGIDEYDNVADISGDGARIVGIGYDAFSSNPQFQAFMAETGQTGRLLGTLPGYVRSAAVAISTDGSTVVGHSEAATGPVRAFRWTDAELMQPLPDSQEGLRPVIASDVSADGSVIVGSGFGPNGSELFIWTQKQGTFSLVEVMVAAGISSVQFDDWELTEITGISADGKTLVGNGINPNGDREAWIATVPEPASALLLALPGLILTRRRSG